jgi:hypothetical protein
MKYTAWNVSWAALVVAGGVWVASGWLFWRPSPLSGAQAAPVPAAEPAAKPAGPPPLVVDKDAPRLLNAGPPKPKAPAMGPVADNSACYVCHVNYEHESLVVEHARENVGCVKCHGESIAHRNDEDNITPPDIMFPTEAIDRNCVQCHETHDAPARKVLARWQERCPLKENPEDLVCTDCHGEHRLRFRTVW